MVLSHQIGRVGLTAALALAVLPTSAAWSAPLPAAVPHKPPLPVQQVDRLILRYAEGGMISAMDLPELPAGLELAGQALGVELDYIRQTGDGAHILALTQPVDAATAERLSAELESFPNVAYAEPDYRDQALLTPGDTFFAQQWSLAAPAASHYGLNAAAAWDLTTGDPNLTVAVIDTGLLFDHPDLVGRAWPGYDFVSESTYSGDGDGRDADASDPGDWTIDFECGPFWSGEDSSWHGTHVAGTIGATGDNGVGVAGLNWQSRILPVRVLAKCGGSSSDIADAIRWAAGVSVSGVPDNPHPARVINLSLGGTRACSATYQSAIDAARGAGAIVVAAAGNSAMDAAFTTPANCVGVISVGATDPDGNLSSFSNYGATVDISAPGGEMSSALDPNGILSTYNSGAQSADAMSYAYLQGTSMAAPHVAGVASLVLSAAPALGPDQVAAILTQTVTPLPASSMCNSGCDDVVPVPCTAEACGHGIVNAGAAVAMAVASSYRQFLPIVAQQSAPPIGLLSGGGFESTKAAPWIAQARSNTGLVTLPPAGWFAHSGRRVAWLGGVEDESAALERTLYVDAQHPRLTFWHWIASAETTTAADVARVVVERAIVWQSELSVATSTSGWVQQQIDLTPYIGRTITLGFEIATNASGTSSWLLDDVAVEANCR